ncbi:MAG: sterol desaturase family protein [Gammaproteobacteria bacterium]|jgi:beta-carotene 3-hydroxylase
MPELLTNLALLVLTFALMEGVAVFSHKYVMHGFLWCWHESHHLPREGIFEKNDLFAAIFAVPSILFFYLGTVGDSRFLWIGGGILLYGIMYFVFHDVIVHRRIRTGYRAKNPYMRRIIEAHWVHHSTTGKAGAVSFGFLYSPPVDQLVAERDRRQRELALG